MESARVTGLLVCGQTEGWSKEQSIGKAGEIHATLLELFDMAGKLGVPTYRAGDRVAERRIEEVRRIHKKWV